MAFRRQTRDRELTRPTMTSSVRSGTASRSGLRQPTRSSIAGRQLARPERHGAVSPSGSVISTATANAGTKRKEREFDPAEEGGEETNINVVVRCRGRNEREVKENSAVMVTTDGVKGKAVELFMGPSALSNKSYSFDRVYSQAADQGMVFDDTVKPILEEVILSADACFTEKRADELSPRCCPATTARFSHTARPAPAKHTQCPAT